MWVVLLADSPWACARYLHNLTKICVELPWVKCRSLSLPVAHDRVRNIPTTCPKHTYSCPPLKCTLFPLSVAHGCAQDIHTVCTKYAYSRPSAKYSLVSLPVANWHARSFHIASRNDQGPCGVHQVLQEHPLASHQEHRR